MLAGAVGPQPTAGSARDVNQLVQPRPRAGLHALSALAARERADRARPRVEYHVEPPRLRLERRAIVLGRVRAARPFGQREVAEGGDVRRPPHRALRSSRPTAPADRRRAPRAARRGSAPAPLRSRPRHPPSTVRCPRAGPEASPRTGAPRLGRSPPRGPPRCAGRRSVAGTPRDSPPGARP